MLIRTAAYFLAAFLLLPDEGQWLPTQVREMDWDALQKRGMKLTRDEFWHPERGGILSATVQISGCTASFVSADGLMMTNHHCGFGAVSALSTVQQNHLENGYAAATRADELPAKGMEVQVLKRIDDVTSLFHEAQAKATSDLERHQVTEELKQKLIREGNAKEPNVTCSIASFLEGREYHMYTRTRLTDVRLVYAPPRAIGEFGGETDNWEWPRHTGDFTFFRAYCAPDGTPRAYDKDNVPFHPQHWLKFSPEGVKDGDLAIVMGYPGNTQRYRTSAGVAVRLDWFYPRREAVLTSVLDVLGKFAGSTPERELAVAATIKSLANVQKNARGMIFGMSRNGTVDRKLREEAEFATWLAADPARTKAHGDVLKEMLAHEEAEAALMPRDFQAGFVFGQLAGLVPLLSATLDACEAALRNKDGKVPPATLAALGNKAIERDLEALQQPVLAILLGEAMGGSDSDRLAGTELLNGTDGAAAAADLLVRTRLTDAATRQELFRGGLERLQASEDPMVQMALGLAKERMDWRNRVNERQGRMLELGRRWIGAQQEFRGRSFYPDANSTLRVSFASVKGYSPRDGVLNTPKTTVAGLLHKETGKEPFANPKALLAAAPNRKSSRFFDAALGDVPVCFLIDGDTTGGNSGSPVVNGKGEVIGLNFDRVFEAVAGDFGWNPDRSRNICVDARYILWVMEAVMPAPAVLKELLGS